MQPPCHPRYAVLGLFLPLLEGVAPGSVTFVIDTSGSVPRSALNAVTAELEAYLLQYPAATLEVLYADAAVTAALPTPPPTFPSASSPSAAVVPISAPPSPPSPTPASRPPASCT
jgi:hypothetical protein